MTPGFEATFQLLARTDNEAALDVLLAGLDSSHLPTRDAALRALMERPSPAGHDEVFRRLSTLDERARAIVEDRPDRLVRVANDVLARSRAGDPDQANGRKRTLRWARRAKPPHTGTAGTVDFRLACEAIVTLRMYDAMPALLAAAENQASPEGVLAGQTVLQLTDAFYAELSSAGEPKRRDIEGTRARISDALQAAASAFAKHQCRAVVEAFLTVVKHQDAGLRRMLRTPAESVHAPIVEVLSSSTRGGVLRLLLRFLEDPQSPQVALDVVGRRADARFVQVLLEAVGFPASRGMTETLTRVRSIAWAQPSHPVFAELDGKAQRGAVGMLCASAVDRSAALATLGYLLAEGKPEGRRAAAVALAGFHGPEANALVLRGLNDPDPEVRASLIEQLRPRKVPGVLSILIRLVDNPHDVVRAALHKALPEFTFKKFLANFDDMPEDLRATAGYLVRKIDLDAVPQLVAEMECLSPVRRRRAVSAATAMGVVGEMEPAVIKLLGDNDHMVRIAAAKALADCKSMPTWEALRDALLDRSVIVREAAEASLMQIAVKLAEDTAEESAEPALAGVAPGEQPSPVGR